MEFRKANKQDIPDIYKIIRQAQEYMKDNGIDQWQDGYPNEDSVNADVENSINYVYCKDDKVVGTIVVLFDGEKDYNNIYQGKWLTNKPYAATHRVAVDYNIKGHGTAGKMISHVEDMCKSKGIESIRVDTHKDNISMRKMLRKNGFVYCGIIYLGNGAERIAFEKVLKI